MERLSYASGPGRLIIRALLRLVSYLNQELDRPNAIATRRRLQYRNNMKGLSQPEGQKEVSLPPAAGGCAGFSMLEMLVTIAIILILTTMYWGSNSGARQRLQKGCEQNLQKLYLALQIYGNNSDGKFPVVPSARTSEEALDVLVPRFNSDTSLFLCPASGISPLPSGDSISKHKISYAYYMGRRTTDGSEALMSDAQVDTQPKTSGQLIFSDTGRPPGNNHKKYGGNLLFCDGHTEWTPSHVPISVSLTQGVVLLNPRP